MTLLTRRHFLGLSLGGIGAATLGSLWPGIVGESPLLADDDSLPFDSLFLTWRSDPTSSMVIQWIGEPDAKITSIEYATLKQSIWQSANVAKKTYPNTSLDVFRCELTGLDAGTEYKFQIGTDSPEFRFRTMPEHATDEFTFVTGGDAGTEQAAVTSNRVAAKQDPYFVVIAGDLAYDNGRSPETFLTFLRNYRATMIDSAGRFIPLVSCLGNHEVNGGYKHDRAAAPSFLSVFDVFFSETSYGVLDFGDYLSLVLLDSGHLSPIGGEQTDWLEQRLKEREEHPHVFAIQHVPCYPSHRNPWGLGGLGGTGVEQRALWSPLFEKHKVNVVLEHHDHTFKRSHPLTDGMVDEQHGVLYLGDGSWGKLRPPVDPEKRPYLAKVGERYHVSMHRLEGERRFHIALDETGKIADEVTTVSQRASL